jgi:VWFA-related protein
MLNALPRKPLTRALGIAIVLSLAAGSGSPIASSRIAAAQGSQAPAATGATTAILVDVVVRDKNGEPVPGLTPEDFEIIEDGVRQELGSFTPIFRDAPREAARTTVQTPTASSTRAAAPEQAAAAHKEAAAQATAAANTPGEILALVFDRLTADNRPLAQRAALSYLGTEVPEGRAIAVYGIDLGLVPYQALTRDVKKVRRAIEEFGTRATSQFGATTAQRRDLEERIARSGAAAQSSVQISGGPGTEGGSGNIGAAVGDQAFLEMQQRSLETFDALERDQEGYSTANALMAIVSGMRTLPGRKALVFFSEGLSITTNAKERFLAVVAAANRANVSIYSVDASGLRAVSPLKETRDEIDAAGSRILRRNPTADQTSEPMLAGLERNETHLQLNPHSGLGMISDQTGGLLVANTNDFRKALSRVDGDLRNYYMLSYVPKNEEFDGQYRQISVKVKRSGVIVQHRKGYYAIRAPAGLPVLAYEAPALAVLDRAPVPNAFPVRVGALTFPEWSRPGLTPVVVEVPTSAATFRPVEGEINALGADLAIVVRVRNSKGDIIDKMSQRYELRTTPEQLEQTKAGLVIFYRQPELPAGVHTLETVVRDGLANKASVRFTTVEIPTNDPNRLRLSSLVLIRRGEKVPESERISDSPLYVGDTLLYPNLAASLKHAVDKELGFYLTVYVPDANAQQTATVDLIQNGAVLARLPLELEHPDAERRIRQVGRLPIDQLAAGSYELRVVVHQGSTTVSRTSQFRIAE